MPLVDVDPNIGPRTSLSRSSNFSGKTGAFDGQHVAPVSSNNSSLPNSAGVLSMLKTTTEVGDIGAFASRSRLPRRPAPSRGLSSAARSGSSHYSRPGSIRSGASSNRSRRSNDHPQPPGSWPRRLRPHASTTDLPRLPYTQVPRAQQSSYSIATTSDHFDLEPRSYSMTTTGRPPHSLNYHPSIASLKRDEHAGSSHSSPYHQSSRFRPPYFRPGSPALSDTMAAPYNRSMMRRPAAGPRAMTSSPLHNGGPAHYYEYDDSSNYRQRMQPILPAEMHAVGRESIPEYQAPIYELGTNENDRRSTSVAVGLMPEHLAPGVMPSHDGSASCREPAHPSVPLQHTGGLRTSDMPHLGFVQRVRQALEQRASSDDMHTKLTPKLSGDKNLVQLHRSAVELPASPMVKRLTRDMIKASLGPPSDTGVMSTDAPLSEGSSARTASTEAGGSLSHARTSSDLPSVSSTPELVNSGSSVAQTVPSSGGDQPDFGIQEQQVALVDMHDEGRERAEEQTCTIEAETAGLESLATVSETGRAPLSQMVGTADDSHDESHSVSQSTARTSTRPVTLLAPNSTQDSVTPTSRQSLPASAVSHQHLNSLPVVLGAVDTTDDEQTISDDSDVEMGQAHIDASLPSSARTSMKSCTNPATLTDPLAWATQSILARKSFNIDVSRQSSVSMTVEPLHVPRSNGTAPVATTAAPGIEEECPSHQSMATVEIPPVPRAEPLAPTESRMSAMKQFHFPLPDLTEDSQEDASTTNLRMLGSRPPNFRGGAPRRARRDARVSPRNGPAARSPKPPKSYLSTSLADTRKMPSLNFSHMDLTTKLNAALGLRAGSPNATLTHSRRAGDENSMVDPSDIKFSLRERYKSFFSEAEETDHEVDSLPHPEHHRLSIPNALFDELDQLSIPSVQGLTVRLSELLPSIKQKSAPSDAKPSELALDDALAQLQDSKSSDVHIDLDRKRASLMSALSAGAMAQARRSVGSPERLHTLMSLTDADTNKDLPKLPTEGKDPRPSLASKSSRRAPRGTTDHSRAKTQSQAAATIDKSKAGSTEVARLGQDDIEDSDVASDDDPTVEVPAVPRDSVQARARGKARVTKSQSMMSMPGDQTDHVVRSMSPGPHMEASLVPVGQRTKSPSHSTSSKRGILNVLQQKIGSKRARKNPDEWHVDPMFLHPEERTVSVTGPGDRYPTTSLSPPIQGHIDDGRSYFDDDSSIEEDVGSRALSKRLSRLRDRYSSQRQNQRRLTSRVETSRTSQHDEPQAATAWMHHQHTDSESQSFPSQHDVVYVYETPPAGMSKLEFRFKRVLERFRIMWCKSGQAVRSMSRARRERPAMYMVNEHVYNGA